MSLLILLTLFVSTVLPMHAGAHGGQADPLGRDFCTTTGSGDAPATPDRAHDDTCVACFVCGGAAAPARSAITTPVVPLAWQDAASPSIASRAITHGHAQARGPPALA